MTGNFGVAEQLLVFQERLCATIPISSHLNYSSKIVMSDWQTGFSSSFQVEYSKFIDYAVGTLHNQWIWNIRPAGQKSMNVW